MRIILVGSDTERARLRDVLDRTGLEVVAEFPMIGDARVSGLDADGILLAPPELDADELAVESLTPRESEVLALLAEGLPNKAIAERLDISDQTVKFHVASVTAKLGAHNRTDAVRRGVRRGLVVL